MPTQLSVSPAAGTLLVQPDMDPIVPLPRPDAFDDPAWTFEPKYDGLRGFIHGSDHGCEIRSPWNDRFENFAELRARVARVLKARETQATRFAEHPGIYANAQMGSKLLKEVCVISPIGAKLLKTAMERLNLSARAYDRILKVSRTIADLDGKDEIRPEHLAEAIQYRSLDREGWAG